MDLIRQIPHLILCFRQKLGIKPDFKLSDGIWQTSDTYLSDA